MLKTLNPVMRELVYGLNEVGCSQTKVFLKLPNVFFQFGAQKIDCAYPHTWRDTFHLPVDDMGKLRFVQTHQLLIIALIHAAVFVKGEVHSD